MTVLGAVMNSQSSKLLSNNLEPVLQKMQDQTPIVTSMIDNIHSDPQSIYSILLSPETSESSKKAKKEPAPIAH
jgi:hypothetical protein